MRPPVQRPAPRDAVRDARHADGEQGRVRGGARRARAQVDHAIGRDEARVPVRVGGVPAVDSDKDDLNTASKQSKAGLTLAFLSMPCFKRVSDTGHKALCPVSDNR